MKKAAGLVAAGILRRMPAATSVRPRKPFEFLRRLLKQSSHEN